MIDWDRVQELRAEIGPECFDEVLSVFVEEVEEVTARLARAPDPATLERDLHFLKGSALNLGFETLAAQCEIGERLAADGATESVDLAQILETYRSSRATFEAELPARFLP